MFATSWLLRASAWSWCAALCVFVLGACAGEPTWGGFEWRESRTSTVRLEPDLLQERLPDPGVTQARLSALSGEDVQDELETLVAPVALYPDALVAQILPASTYPVEIVQAARAVRGGLTDAEIDAQAWDPSVKAVARYSSVLEKMDADLDWTQRLGEAFLARPEEVMAAIQRLRVKARDFGNLVDTPEQIIVVDDSAIRIIPATPTYIYVPTYDVSVVYVRRCHEPAVFFGIGYTCGTWLDLDCDWRWRHCYRPGWSWNCWRDHFVIERGCVVRPDRHHDYASRQPNVWHRDTSKPGGRGSAWANGSSGRRSGDDHRGNGRDGRGQAGGGPRDHAGSGPIGVGRIQPGAVRPASNPVAEGRKERPASSIGQRGSVTDRTARAAATQPGGDVQATRSPAGDAPRATPQSHWGSDRGRKTPAPVAVAENASNPIPRGRETAGSIPAAPKPSPRPSTWGKNTDGPAPRSMEVPDHRRSRGESRPAVEAPRPSAPSSEAPATRSRPAPAPRAETASPRGEGAKPAAPVRRTSTDAPSRAKPAKTPLAPGRRARDD